MKHNNLGHTPCQAVDWKRACRWAAKHTLESTGRLWHDDKVATFYMQARNGYIAGYNAAKRSRA